MAFDVRYKMKRKLLYTLGATLVAAFLGLLVYGQYFRPLRIWVDGQSWEVSGPGQLRGITVSSRLFESPESDFDKSWATVAVPFLGSDGSIGTYTAPKPRVSGAEIDLALDTVQFVEATSSSGKQWVYKIQLKKN